jgi:hypothetical protein
VAANDDERDTVDSTGRSQATCSTRVAGQGIGVLVNSCYVVDVLSITADASTRAENGVWSW